MSKDKEKPKDTHNKKGDNAFRKFIHIFNSGYSVWAVVEHAKEIVEHIIGWF